MAGEAVNSPDKVCAWLKQDTLISRHFLTSGVCRSRIKGYVILVVRVVLAVFIEQEA